VHVLRPLSTSTYIQTADPVLQKENTCSFLCFLLAGLAFVVVVVLTGYLWVEPLGVEISTGISVGLRGRGLRRTRSRDFDSFRVVTIDADASLLANILLQCNSMFLWSATSMIHMIGKPSQAQDSMSLLNRNSELTCKFDRGAHPFASLSSQVSWP
jgi:hypothetical protein